MPLCAGRIGQHRHRGPGVHAGKHGLPDGGGPGPVAGRARAAGRRLAARDPAQRRGRGRHPQDVPRRGGRGVTARRPSGTPVPVPSSAPGPFASGCPTTGPPCRSVRATSRRSGRSLASRRSR
ncbi:hypothetical protein G6F31_021438 [Rhizopus arrhizus]|nr:hypothetical protein G6F31_021438 [Rhizopus arrhizus]